MASPATNVDDFLSLVEKSGLLSPAQLGKIAERVAAHSGQPLDPRAVAAGMLKAALLTPYQARQLLSGKTGGFFYGKYKVLDMLGEGGMAKVYLSEHV
ncbi:MAG: hypothetical protein ACRDD1_15310, partial [Planctomycetia bacterium]